MHKADSDQATTMQQSALLVPFQQGKGTKPLSDSKHVCEEAKDTAVYKSLSVEGSVQLLGMVCIDVTYRILNVLDLVKEDAGVLAAVNVCLQALDVH